jgi:hypothetical protein
MIGCYPHEEMYKEFAQFMGIDSASNTLICFDIGDPKVFNYQIYLGHYKIFRKVYLKVY